VKRLIAYLRLCKLVERVAVFLDNSRTSNHFVKNAISCDASRILAAYRLG
jgi:hypothetical protein